MFKDAIEYLKKESTIGIIPTDTLYGVVCRAQDHQAVNRLYKLKQRDNKPGTVIAANVKQLEELGLKHRYLKAVEGYWPNAISIIIPTSNPNLSYLYKKQMSLAVRIPKLKYIRELLISTGPLLTSSANPKGQPPAKTIKEAKAYFDNQVDFYIDGGDLSNRKPSTVIRIIDDAVDIIRQGAVILPDDTISP